MRYKTQGFGAGPTTPRMWVSLTITLIVLIAAYIGFCWAMLTYARAQPAEHIHGVTVPDWYDADCCDRQDCFPVEKESDIEPMKVGDVPAFKHVPTGQIFIQGFAKFRTSKDERYHVCIYKGAPLCIYLPSLS